MSSLFRTHHWLLSKHVWVYVASQNIPRAVVLTLGNKVVLYVFNYKIKYNYGDLVWRCYLPARALRDVCVCCVRVRLVRMRALARFIVHNLCVCMYVCSYVCECARARVCVLVTTLNSTVVFGTPACHNPIMKTAKSGESTNACLKELDCSKCLIARYTTNDWYLISS